MPLIPLSEERGSAFPEGIFDLRGWEVRAMSDGEKVGLVEDLLLDDRGSTRYLAVDLITHHKQTLIPIERTRADEAEMVVWVPGLNSREAGDLPTYDRNPNAIDDAYEARVSEAYEGLWAGVSPARGAESGVEVEEEGRVAPGLRPGPESSPRWGPLASLGELDAYDIAAGDPDPRGWSVIFNDHRRVGQVHDLIVEPAAEKVRYLDCLIDTPIAGRPAGGRHLLIPMEPVRLDPKEELVYVDTLASAEIADLPSFSGLPLAAEDEYLLDQAFNAPRRGDRERN